ncbi:MAG TPA: LTA synthase family protein, partial [Clostridiales bacterium]|nr:LTA synthase family protein [Clostridiales bacterium]
ADGGAPSAPFGQTKGQNIIFLQVESLENFTIGNEINGQEITPNINKMLDHSYRFNRVYEQVKGGNSSDCDLMLMTSMLPIENGPAFILYEQSSFHSLPSILREEGNYYTAYFNGEKNSMWNYEMVMESAIQFDTYSMDYSQDVIYNQYLSDESMLNQTLPKVVQVVQDAGENPFYAHIVLCSSHMPFQLPQEEWLLDLPS